MQPPGTIDRLPLGNDTSFTAAERQRYGVTAGFLRSVVGRFDNVARTHTQGVDIAGKGSFASPVGNVLLGMDAVYLSMLRYWSATRGGWGDNLVGRAGNARWRLVNSVTLESGAWAHTLRALTTTRTSQRGDYFDTTYTDAGCQAAGYSIADCRTAGYTRWNYGLRYTGLKQLTLGVSIDNVSGAPAPKGAASWLNGGGIFPPSSDDARGRMLRLTVEWRVQ